MQQRKSLVLILVKQRHSFAKSLYYNHDNSYLFVNRKWILSLKQIIKNFNVLSQFCLGSISNKYYALESRDTCFEGNVHGFSVDYNAISGRCKLFKFLPKCKTSCPIPPEHILSR